MVARKKKKRPKKKPTLSPKHKRFVEEYLIDLNGKQAAIRAGYSPRSAEVTASTILSYPKVAEAVAKAIQERSARTKMDADEVLREFARIARSNILDYVSFERAGVGLRDSTELTEDQSRAIAEVSERVNAQGVRQRKFKLHDKNKALENLAKHLGLLADRLEHTGKGGKPIEVRHFTDEMVASLRRRVLGKKA